MTLISKDSDNGIEWKQIGELELIKNAKSDMGWVVANETSCNQIVLMGVNTKDFGMNLKDMRLWNGALQKSGEIGELRRC